MNGLVDSTVIIHLLRGNPAAQTWLSQQDHLGLTPIVWLEVIEGARGKQGQAATLEVLQSFEIVYLTQVDQTWTMNMLVQHRLSDGVAINDCLIASVCHRLQLPIYTHNTKHMTRLLDPALVIQPY
jgi:predicted nucleic acid-binding protein